MALVRRIETKLGRMRKVVDWVVYPAGTSEGLLVIQSDRRIASFKDDGTNKGMLSKSANYATFMHLSPVMGATEVDVPQEVIDMAKAAQPQTGDRIGGCVFVG